MSYLKTFKDICVLKTFVSGNILKELNHTIMRIFEQIQEVLKEKTGCQVTSTEIKNELNDKYGTNKSSVILPDYCYNRINDGIKFKNETRIFEYKSRNKYKYLGQGYPYTGKIVHKPTKSKEEKIVGEWINGQINYIERMNACHSGETDPSRGKSLTAIPAY